MNTTTTSTRRPHLRTLLAIIAIASLGASCDDDDAAAPAPQPTSADSTTSRAVESIPTTGGGNTENEVFCQAALDAERAAATEDTAAIESAFDAVAAAAPADVKAAVDTVIAESRAGNEDSPQFGTAYGDLIDYIKDNCGFGTLAVTASEYAFGGIADTLEAGPVVIDFSNTGQELHHVAMMRINDDVTDTLDELLALPEAQAQHKLTAVGNAFAAPGEVGFGMVDLEPGRYIAICYLPTGATPENMPQIESGEHQGAPHFTHGMVQEFTVS